MTWTVKKLAEIATINPSRPRIIRDDDAPTTFVPMNAVDELTGTVARVSEEPFRKLKKGYTYFEENDVIFAKITPCMQNGKHAIVRNLKNGFGFGSTEFHVIRASNNVLPEWIHYFVRQQSTLDAAVNTFTGSVGQQRVPELFLQNLEVPLPPINQQRRFVQQLKARFLEVEQARQAARKQLEELDLLPQKLLGQGHSKRRVSLGDALDEIKEGIGSRWADFPALGATRSGLAPAKEQPGKHAARYKPVNAGTVFYNPMRILIGSIAFVDEDDETGITSPDYVVLKGKPGVVDSRWFYYWLRSPWGEQCIQSLARGAVRERMLFNRLAEGEIELPDYNSQVKASLGMRQIRPLRAAIRKQIYELELLPQKLLAQVFGN